MADEPAIVCRQGRFKGWDSWHLKSGPVELVLVPQVGGRIMGILWRGHDLLFTHPDLEGRVICLTEIQDVSAKKRELGFLLWGGDKTWLAPQPRWTEGVPFLDLDSGSYDLEIENAGPDRLAVHMISPVCRETGIRITRSVTMVRDEPGWTVMHRITNESSATVEWGIWDVTMVRKPARVYIPRAKSPYPDGIKTFEEEGESIQAREKVVREMGTLAVVQCDTVKAFKFGVNAEEGWMMGIIEIPGRELVGYRKTVPTYRDDPLGYGCIAEIYNSDRYPYFEMELHSPVTRLQPGEAFQLQESQCLFDVDRWPLTEAEVRKQIGT